MFNNTYLYIYSYIHIFIYSYNVYEGGPGITQSDLFVINKTDLADAVGSNLDIMKRDTELMRGAGPYVFSQVKHGPGMQDIVSHVENAYLASQSRVM